MRLAVLLTAAAVSLFAAASPGLAQTRNTMTVAADQPLHLLLCGCYKHGRQSMTGLGTCGEENRPQVCTIDMGGPHLDAWSGGCTDVANGNWNLNIAYLWCED